MKFHTTKTFFLTLNMIQKEMKKNKLIRNYSPNGEWETIFYHNGKPSHIVRKECTIVEN